MVLPEICPGGMETISRNIDFLGVNYLHDHLIQLHRSIQDGADVLLEAARRGIESHGCNRFKPIKH